MNELKKTNRLIIVVSALLIILAAGLLTLRKPEIKYSMSPAGFIELLRYSNNFVSPKAATSIIDQHNEKNLFIDVRTPAAFSMDHIKDAITIPVHELFSAQRFTFLRNAEKAGQTIYIYGETPRQANGPWILLRHTGFSKVKLINGALFQPAGKDKVSMTAQTALWNEFPMIDTAALKKSKEQSVPVTRPTPEPKPDKKTVVPAATSPSTGGGC